MKIVLPVHHFPPRYSAGAELYTFRLARWLIQHGHAAEVVCVERIDDTDAENIRIFSDVYEGVPVQRLSFDIKHAAQGLRWSYRNPLVLDWFTSYLEHTRPDLVHLQSGYMITASVLEAAHTLGIPSVLTLHDFWFLCPRITLLRGNGHVCDPIPADPAGCAWCLRLDSRRYRLPDQLSAGLLGKIAQTIPLQDGRSEIAERRDYLQTALAWPEAVIAPSHFLARQFTHLVEAERLHILRYGLDSSQLQRTPVAPHDGVLRLGYLGQVARHKGVHLLVEAVKMLPATGRPVEMTIYGDLNQHEAYSKQLQRQANGDRRIRFAGRFNHGTINQVLGSVEATIVPSIWYENSPLAIMEAHAAKRPVITSALGGMAELIRHDVDGLHFRPNDAADLATQIQRLRDEPDLLPRLRDAIIPPATIGDEMKTLLDIYWMVTKRAIGAVGVA